MEMMPEHKAAGWKTPIWDTYKGIIVAANGATEFEEVERFAFYERSKKAYCVVATGETALYGNLIIKKESPARGASAAGACWAHYSFHSHPPSR